MERYHWWRSLFWVSERGGYSGSAHNRADRATTWPNFSSARCRKWLLYRVCSTLRIFDWI